MQQFRLGSAARTRLSSALAGVAVLALAAAVTPAATAATVCTGGCGSLHVTDGAFTNVQEWNTARPTVNKTVFAKGTDGSGGAALYVEQTGGTLYLMYDYYNPQPGFTVNTLFDVFFQVPSQKEDYLAQIQGNSVTVFSKPASSPSLVNPDGTLNNGAPWSPADAADLQSGRFQGAVGFSGSPDSSTPHPMAEFQLTIDQTRFSSPPPNPQSGLYDPAPAFWGASVGSGGQDPPISSAIFQLDPNGTTNVNPVLNPVTGGPVSQGNVDAPEPASIVVLAAGLLGLAVARRQGASK